MSTVAAIRLAIGFFINIVVVLSACAQMTPPPETIETLETRVGRSVRGPAFSALTPPLNSNQNPKRRSSAGQGLVTSEDSQGNLPAYAHRKRSAENFQSPVVVVKSSLREKFPELIRGTILKARINDSIQAYEGSISFVRAVVTEGPLRGAVIAGNATMDKVTKNAVVKFDTFITPDSRVTYSFNAELKNQDGISGLHGEVESDYWKYFWTTLALDTASAAADATTQRSTTPWGLHEVIPGPDSAVRQGIAGGLSKTVERIAEKNQYIPEFVTVRGPVFIRVAVTSQPERNKE